ncbi:MAG: PilW family protein [Candidatus Komeilibacteria bacterium]
MRKNFVQDNRGFTLLEMLVVSAIFILTLTAVISIFVNTNRAQKRLANSEKLQADTRYVVEVMAREIRNGRIDYDNYTEGIDNPVSELKLLDYNDSAVWFRRAQSGNHNTIQVCRGSGCANSEWYDITPDDITVTQLKLFISPNVDPFTLTGPNTQPLVHIGLTTQSLTPDLDEYKWIRYQTAVTTRYYAR